MKDYRFNTKCVQGVYEPKNGEPRVMPIVQSTTYKYESSEQMGKLFDLEESGYFYTRLANPTCDYTAGKIAQLEGGVGAMLTSSGQAASFYSVFNICRCGDHLISTSAIYGGTFNLFAVTMKRMGIEFTFISPDCTDEEFEAAFKENTKAVFAETIANPALTVLDIERFADMAHRHGVPLIVDNTFATPILCRPIEYGADIVIHSTSKYMDGHAVQVGGVIVDSGKFDWSCGNFPSLTEPDESYHGLRYVETYGKLAYILKARMQLMRDFGVYPAAHSAFLLNMGLETLAVRMKQYCENALTVAKYLEANENVISVKYPGLESNEDYALAKKYLKGCSGVISFRIKGGKEAAIRFMNSLSMASNEVHVADIHTCVLHPASETHRQLTDEQVVACGITPDLVRFSVGLENVEDIIADIEQAMEKAFN